jgi:hypothetical protein
MRINLETLREAEAQEVAHLRAALADRRWPQKWGPLTRPGRWRKALRELIARKVASIRAMRLVLNAPDTCGIVEPSYP